MDDKTKIVLQFLRGVDKKNYIGERISQLEHALQAAYFAEQSNHSEEVIVASLFHDIGHFASDSKQFRMAQLGIVNHEWIGAKLAYDAGFSKKIALLIGYHVNAKRYLITQKPHYYERLSEASKQTLAHQGGPMSVDEITHFEKHSFFKEILQVRINDEKAKEVNLSVPDLEHYIPLIQKHLRQDTTFHEAPLKDYVKDKWITELKNFLEVQ